MWQNGFFFYNKYFVYINNDKKVKIYKVVFKVAIPHVPLKIIFR